jgi:aryl-alcohol dehydrogenase-like predicted oxidoreductase
VLARGEHVLAIPGTTSLAHLQDNMGALQVQLSAAHLALLDGLINQQTVHGPRYNAPTQTEIDTEEFAV